KDHPDVTVLRRLSHGGARDALLTAAHDAQLLVVGARGRGGIAGMTLGSVRLAALHHAPCPVGVARSARDAWTAGRDYRPGHECRVAGHFCPTAARRMAGSCGCQGYVRTFGPGLWSDG